jgi:tetratricopeptide (TPR) repeat protein
VSSIGTLAADGAQQMTIRRLAGGDQGIMLRTLQPALQEANAVKQLAGALLDDDGIGSSLVSTATIDVPAAWEAPVDLSYVAQVKYNLADTIKKRTLWIPTPTLWLPDPDKVPLPWRLPFTDTLRIRSTTHYTLPEGWGAQPPVAVQLTQPFAQYRSRYAVAGRELTIERELDVSPFDLDEQHRVAYTRFRTAVLDDRAQQFGLTLPTASTSLSATSTADLNARGLRAFDARRFTEARDLFTALTVAEPNHPHAWNELGRTYLQLGEHEAARAALERQVAVDPLHPYAYSNLGTAYQRLGRVADAEQAYRKQIEIVPLDKWSHRSLGLLFLEQGRLPDAIAALERAVTITRDDRYLRLHLGRAYLKSGDITKAVQIFDEEASATPLYPGHLNDAAYWLAEAGVELPRARRWAERVVALTHGALGGSTLPQMRDRDLGPLATVVMVWDTLGWTAFHQNDLAAARLWLESAHAWSDSREIAVHAGTLREREGRPADALRAYRRAARGTKPVSGADAGAYATATRAIARLNASGAAAPTDDEAVDLASRQSTVKVPGLAGPVSGDVLVSIGTESTVDEALLLGDDGPQALIDAVQGTAVPGADIARLKQVRLFRRAAFACDVKGTCTLTWGRVP